MFLALWLNIKKSVKKSKKSKNTKFNKNFKKKIQRVEFGAQNFQIKNSIYKDTPDLISWFLEIGNTSNEVVKLLRSFSGFLFSAIFIDS